jgi:ATP-binding cassette subfamily C protein CydD
MEAIGAAERMVELLETPVPEAAKRHRLRAQTPMDISLERVSYRYPDGRIGVADLSFQVHSGETLALVGPSGAGKSTTINLLLGFLQPQGGMIRIAGRPLAAIDSADWHRQIALLPQRATLFPASVLENIRLARPDASLEAVREAARLARADRFIECLPGGYGTLVGEGGRRLSGGEVQRIALARAFLKDAPLVLLDEATANLDLESEGLIRQGLGELARNRTLIMVAHRLSTVQRLPRILVLDQGRLIEQGSHDQLLQHRGHYARLVAAYGAA